MSKPRSLMTAYAEGSIVSRELRDMLNDEAASERFERELAVLDAEAGNFHGGHHNADLFARRASADIDKRMAKVTVE